jgi:hypothetical protein
MTQQDIRDLIRAHPFQPFRLHLVDGNSLRVPHPDFIIAAASMAVVANELPKGVPGAINLIPYEHIARVELLPRKTRKLV